MKKNISIILVILFVILFVILLFYLFCDKFGSGLYLNSEKYIFKNISNTELINAINKFKEKNIEYKYFSTLEDGTLYEPDGYVIHIIGEPTKVVKERNDSSFYYSCYFHIPIENFTFSCRINVSIYADSIPAYILFVNVSEGKNGTWKDINTNALTKKENEKMKNIFETQILNKLGKWESN